MSAFQFPDPASQQSVTNPSTGSTYEWKADPGKWVLVASTIDIPVVDLTPYLTVDAFNAGQETQGEVIDANTEASEKNALDIVDNTEASEQNALDIAELRVTKGAVARYVVKAIGLTVASRNGELIVNSTVPSEVVFISFADFDENGMATRPTNVDDLIEFVEVAVAADGVTTTSTGDITRYKVVSGDTAGLTVEYLGGANDFEVGEPEEVFIYPQNKEGVSKEYVDNQDALKLNLTGGSLTGNLSSTNNFSSQKSFISKTGGSSNYGFLLNDQSGNGYRLGISHVSATADRIKYSAMTGSSHSFVNYDTNGGNPTETFRISKTRLDAYSDLNITAPAKVIYKNSDQVSFFNLSQQSADECRLNVAKGKSFKITGYYNNTVTNLFQINDSGNVLIHRVVTPTKDTMAANKAYVDSKVAPNATGAIKGIAKLGQLPQGTSVPSLDRGQLFYNQSNKTLLLKA